MILSIADGFNFGNGDDFGGPRGGGGSLDNWQTDEEALQKFYDKDDGSGRSLAFCNHRMCL
jgi:hypothetical protein